MRRYIVLLLITGNVWAQTEFDKLISKAGTKYLGEYSKLEDRIVYFKPKNALEFQAIPLELIESLKLKDGKVIIKNGNVKSLMKIIEYEKLSIEEKAIYDAKKDARKWLVFPHLALISSGGLSTATFFIFDDSFDTEEGLFLIPAFLVGSYGLVGTYYLFSIEDKKNIEGTSADDIELYKEMYYKQFEIQKLKNIIISTGATALIAGAAIFIVFSHMF